jgi:predicted CXXCH cytochrome family protein
MKHVTKFSLLLLLVVSLACLSFAGIQTARIVIKGVSPDIIAEGVYDAVSSGLPNVGKGQKVWLEALALYTSGTTVRDSWVDTIISKTWTIVGPEGSAITAPIEAGATTYFIPDTTGAYQVKLSVTTANGTANTSIIVNSAKWVGVGKITSSRATFPQCALCHGDKEATWKNTPHASMFSNSIDGKNGTYYAKSCISCHTTGFDQSPTATNNGFDDRASASGWVFPSQIKAGNWDSMKVHYPDVANMANIQCENCHGPGSGHYGQTDQNQTAVSFSADVCGQCHGAKTHHVKNSEWNITAHAISYGEPGAVEHMNSSSCTPCHTAQGYVYENLGGQTSAAPYADVQGVTCAACHDPHEGNNPSQLRVASLGDACDGCHKTRISSRGLHHSVQGPMLAGANGTPFTLGTSGVGNWGGLQFPGYQYYNSSHSNISSQCVECHMAPIEGADTALIKAPFSQYVGKLGGHTFRVLYDNGTPDDNTDDILNPVGCKECHGNVSLQFVESSQEKTKALLEELRKLLPHATSGDTTQPLTHTDAKLTTIQKAAAYNYYFVSYDGSYGIHNFEYAAALLRSSIEMVKLGAGAADITSVKDVPNDQGKQVQVVWNKFPAESYPDPVTNYMVLRQDVAGSVPKTAASVTATSYTDMLTKVGSGSTVMLNGIVWTKVGEYKAINMSQYSMVVPTLFDSTVVGGLKLSTFEIVGYTSGKSVYTSGTATGYSVDNLAPRTPAGFAGSYASNVVQLNWSEPVDQDFKYFAIYRSNIQGFDPRGTTPVATSTGTSYTDASVEQGVKYYYKLSAFDFSGNESPYTPEINFLALGVNDQVGIPTEFALDQNYPNPFNPSTQISYQLPKAVHVRIVVYNTLGVEVATIADRDQEPGYYYITWNGHDNSGKSVASGIYLYKIEAGAYSAVKKMILMK